MPQPAPERKIVNVRFRDSVTMRTETHNYHVGQLNGTVVLDKGGVLIDIPADGTSGPLLILVPFSNIKSIHFEIQ